MFFTRFSYLLFFGLVISSCKNGQYQFQVFTFPSSIAPHENGWQYKAVTKVSTDASGSLFRRSDKTVQIRILDDRDQEYLNQEYNLSAVSNITANVQWERLESLNVELVERGSDRVDDSYSIALAQSGPQVIDNLQYEYNSQKNIYELVGKLE